MSKKITKKTSTKSTKKTTKASAKRTPKKTKTVAKKQVVQTVNTTAMQNKPAKSNKQVKLFLIIAVVLAGLYFFKHLFIVALVNGQPISRIAILKDLEKRQGQMLLDQYISETLIYQEAKRQGISVDQEEVDEEMSKLEESYGMQGGDLEELLKLQGMTKEDLSKQIKIQKIIEQMLTDEATVTEEEVDQYIEDNKDYFAEGEDPETMKDEIQEQLVQQKMSEKFQEMLDNLKVEANIKYFLEY